MEAKYTLVCPDGNTITSTVETLIGVAGIESVVITEHGWDVEHDGYTEVDWDSETTLQRDGEDVFMCEAGDEHKRSELTLQSHDTGEYEEDEE